MKSTQCFTFTTAQWLPV